MAAFKIVSIFLAGCLIVPSLALAESDGACTAPKVVEKTSAVDVPSYTSEEESDAPDPQVEAEKVAWKTYHDGIVAMLKSSPDPRDWALTSFGFSMLPAPGTELPDRVLLTRAVNAAPDDPLVLWMAISGYKKAKDTVSVDSVIEKLQRAEPDNAAVWFESLQKAALSGDPAGVTAALKRMSTTSRLDYHLAELNKLIVGAYERVPIPDDAFETLPADARPSKETIPQVYATAVASALALPAFQFVVNACRVDASGRNADRTQDCDLVGHLMKANSDTLIGTMIGFSVLRVSHTFTDDDVREARDLDWVYEQWSQRALKQYENRANLSDPDVGTEIVEYSKDWLESGHEIDAARRSLIRANIAVVAPDGWVDQSPRFSAERMASDANYFADHPVAY